MEIQHWLTLVGIIIGFVFQAVFFAVILTWKLAGVKEDLSADIIEHRDELSRELAADRRVVGESMQALRQKINDVELETSKVYVRRDSWHQSMNQLQETISKTDAADQQWKLRIEEKFDRLAERITGHGARA